MKKMAKRQTHENEGNRKKMKQFKNKKLNKEISKQEARMSER